MMRLILISIAIHLAVGSPTIAPNPIYTVNLYAPNIDKDLAVTHSEKLCGDWNLYEEEMCFKAFEESLLTLKSAKEFCKKQSPSSVVLQIKSKREQEFYEDYLFGQLQLVDNIWLGADEVNNSHIPNQNYYFTWPYPGLKVSDHMDFNNWAENNPLISNTTDNCIQMQATPGLNGMWITVPCRRKGLVVCQKAIDWSQSKIQFENAQLKKDINRLIWEVSALEQRVLDNQAKSANESKNLQNKIQDLALKSNVSAIEQKLLENESKSSNELRNLKNQVQDLAPKSSVSVIEAQVKTLVDNPIPKGYIFFQLPWQAGPEKVWPGVKWTEVTSTYAGVFFRALGGDAAAFGTVQQGNAPRLTEVRSFLKWGTATLADEIKYVSIPSGGTSPKLWTGDDVGGTRNLVSTQFTASGGEVRPKNLGIKIWRRD